MTRRCQHKKCKHLAPMGMVWCRPHFNTRLKRLSKSGDKEELLKVIQEQVYAKPFGELLTGRSAIDEYLDGEGAGGIHSA